MATPPLLLPAALADFPGAPFTDALVESAAATVRSEVGWHIAPTVTETVIVESDGGRYLFLPTLQLTAVTAVRDVTDEDADPTAVTRWRSHATSRFRAGVLHRPAGWRCGVFEVDVEHGYAECPADLLPALAAVIQAERQGSANVRLGSLSITPGNGDADTAAQAIGRYKIPPRP